MFRLLRRLLLVLVVLLLLGAGALYLGLGRAISGAVEHAGTRALGVPVALGSAQVAPFDGALGLEGLVVSNPTGFQTPHFLALERADVQVALGTLTEDVVRIDRVELSGVDLNLEGTLEGTNFGAILDSLEKLKGPEEPAEPAPEEPAGGKETKVKIAELVVRDVRLHTRFTAAVTGVQEAALTLPELRLSNLGGNDGAPLSEVIGEVVSALLRSSLEVGGKSLPLDASKLLERGLGELKQGVLERVGDDVQRGLDSVERTLKGLLK